jgi:hypothetical protein
MKRQILSTFGNLLEISSAIDPPLETGDLALHIWKRQRTFIHPISGVLKRTVTYRMSTQPNNRNFTPTKGVGVVGLCWQHNHEVSWDVTELVAELTDEAAHATYVRVHGRDSVMGLSWREFELVKHRTAVFATPIPNGRGHFVGCVSVDASRGFDVLKRRRLIAEMGDLALAVGREGFECT